MFVAFRTDGGTHIGSGHVMRCLNLAQSLRMHGAEVLFICQEQPGHLCGLISQRGFAVECLATASGLLVDDWISDAKATREILEARLGRKVDWLIVDHYRLDSRWERAVRELASRLMVIDDLCDRNHDCDLLLDQNLVPNMHDRYAKKIPVCCRQLLGPSYALLHPDYKKLHDYVKPHRETVERILIFFGGADRANFTDRALEAFIALDRSDIEVEVVIGASNRHGDAIRQKVQVQSNVRVHSDLPSLAPLMSRADLAIGAGGSTHWERLCLGLPCLVVTLADNQRLVSQELHRLGVIELLGHHDEVNQSMLFQALDRWVRQGVSKEWSLRCMGIVDGRGSDRVAAAIG